MMNKLFSAFRASTIVALIYVGCTDVCVAANSPIHDPALARNHALLYISDRNASQISVFDLSVSGTPRVQRITSGLIHPGPLAVDGNGNLYVTNTHNVVVFPFGAKRPSLTLTDDIDPYAVAVRSDGTVYVGGCCAGRIDNFYSRIDIFPPGQTTHTQTVVDPLISSPQQMLFDSVGNLYVADFGTTVYEIPAGSTKPVSLGLYLNTAAAGIALDERKHLLYVVNDDDGVRSVYAYRLGKARPAYKFDGDVEFIQAVFGDVNFPNVFVTDYLYGARQNVLIYPAHGRSPIGSLHVPGEPYGIAYKAPQ